MIIKEIHIYGFGKFHDFHLGPLPKGIQVLEGENEAGKSTLLHFLRYTLFGYPSRKSKRPQYEPLNGGKHGGRILVELKDGRQITVERLAGTKNGVLRIFEGERVIENPEYWQHLTSTADLDLYENIYAFSLEELSGLASLDRSGMQDRISNALLGLRDVSLMEIESDLADRASKIHEKRKRKSEIIALLKKYEELEQAIEKLRNGLPQYEELSSEIARIGEESEKKEEEQRKLKEKIAFLERAIRSRKHLNRMREAEEQLETLPPYRAFPEKYAEEMKRLETKLEDAKANEEKLKSRILKLEEDRHRITVDDDLLKKEDALQLLQRESGKYEIIRKEQADFERQKKERRLHIDAFIRDNELKMDAGDLLSFEGIETLKSRIRSLESAIRERELQDAASAVRKPSPISGKAGLLLILALLFMTGGLAIIVSSDHDLAGVALTGISALFFILYSQALQAGKIPGKNRSADEKERLRKELSELLAAAGLPAKLEAHDALDLINRLEKERDHQLTLLSRNKEMEEKIHFATRFEEKVRELAGEESSDDPLARLEIMAGKLAVAKEALKEREGLEKEMSLARKELQNVKEKMDKLIRKGKEVMDTCGAASRMDFWAILEKDQEAGHWLNELKSARAALRDEVGDQNLEKVREYLEKNAPGLIENRLRETSERLENLEKEIKDLNTQKGYKESERARLASENSLNEALSKRNNLETRIRELRTEWLSYQLALKMLERVKEKYEKEKQPKVIRLASEYFKRITEGAYPQITVPFGSSEFMLIDSGGTRKSVDQLSRGTREQLLVSIRLALIEEYEEHNEPLPVVMDDVMVNFDPERARQTATVLQDFAAGRQLLYFSCHPATRSLFPNAGAYVLPVGM